jgi:hypothetical protein
MDISSDSKTTTATATTGTAQTSGHILLDWKMSTDEKTRETAPKVTIGTLPNMVKVSVKITGDMAIPVSSEAIKARCASGNFYRVAFEGFDIDKAWQGFGGNNNGFTFKANKAVLLNA